MGKYLAASGDKVTNPVLGPTLSGKTGLEFFQSLLPSLVTLALVIAAIIFVFMFIFGAITWITSGGNKDSVAVAKSRVSNAIIGLIVLLLIFAFIAFLESFFHINILAIDLSGLFIK